MLVESLLNPPTIDYVSFYPNSSVISSMVRCVLELIPEIMLAISGSWIRVHWTNQNKITQLNCIYSLFYNFFLLCDQFGHKVPASYLMYVSFTKLNISLSISLYWNVSVHSHRTKVIIHTSCHPNHILKCFSWQFWAVLPVQIAHLIYYHLSSGPFLYQPVSVQRILNVFPLSRFTCFFQLRL